MGHIKLHDLQLETGWSAGASYAQAKLALVMYTIELAEELSSHGVTVNALNPGFINTNLLREMSGAIRIVFGTVMKLFGSPPEVGGDRIVRLAISSEYQNVTGKFVFEDRITEPNKEAANEQLRFELLEKCRKMVSRWL